MDENTTTATKNKRVFLLIAVGFILGLVLPGHFRLIGTIMAMIGTIYWTLLILKE